MSLETAPKSPLPKTITLLRLEPELRSEVEIFEGGFEEDVVPTIAKVGDTKSMSNRIAAMPVLDFDTILVALVGS